MNLLHGDRAVVDALLDHPGVRAISFVGVDPRLPGIFMREPAERGKRVQCQGGAKNHVLVLPDADIKTAVAHY